MVYDSSSTEMFEVAAHSCFFHRFFRLILAWQLCFWHIAAEQYYYQYRVRSTSVSIVSYDAQCINMCLTAQTCTAASICHSASTVCYLKYDGAIKLMSANTCYTVVLGKSEALAEAIIC